MSEEQKKQLEGRIVRSTKEIRTVVSNVLFPIQKARADQLLL